MFCSECGKQVADDAKFCGECGAAQADVELETFKATSNTIQNCPSCNAKGWEHGKQCRSCGYTDGKEVTAIRNNFQAPPTKASSSGNSNIARYVIGAIALVVLSYFIDKNLSSDKTRTAEIAQSNQVESVDTSSSDSNSIKEGQYGSSGYFLIKNNTYTFDDAKVEGNSMLDMQGTDGSELITVYGYIASVYDLPNDPMEPLRLRIHPGEIGKYKSLGNIVTTNTDLAFDLVYRPQFMSEEEFKNVKRTVLKVAGNKALIKIQGRIGLYSDSFKLFIAGTTLDIAAMDKE